MHFEAFQSEFVHVSVFRNELSTLGREGGSGFVIINISVRRRSHLRLLDHCKANLLKLHPKQNPNY